MKLSIAEKLVFHKIKQRLGGRIKFIVSGGAAMPVHVAEFFAAIGIRVLEGYGLTETSPFISVNEYDRQIIGTVGRVGPEQEVAIQNIETGEMITIQTYESMRPDFECAEGEILMRGPNLMKGYWNQPEETKQVIDSEGWFHTGDIGKFYLGNLKITDRLKNILVNAYGKNIYPTLVENTYLISRKIEQIFIIGDKRDYLTAIIVPAQDELREHFSMEANYFNDPNLWIEEKEVRDWLAADVTKFGNQLAKFERIRDFVVKRHAFSVETGEMTPKQSIKRKVVEKNYAETVNAMYARNTQED
jgi:long-chain acyl-CoA synthetase